MIATRKGVSVGGGVRARWATHSSYRDRLPHHAPNVRRAQASNRRGGVWAAVMGVRHRPRLARFGRVSGFVQSQRNGRVGGDEVWLVLVWVVDVLTRGRLAVVHVRGVERASASRSIASGVRGGWVAIL